MAHITLIPKSKTLIKWLAHVRGKPPSSNFNFRTLTPKPQARTPIPETAPLKPKTQNPKRETPHAKISNPKPEILCQVVVIFIMVRGWGVWEASQVHFRQTIVYRGTSLKRDNPLLGSYSKTMPRVLWWSQGGRLVSYGRDTPVIAFMDYY